jgi:hypothetical protein
VAVKRNGDMKWKGVALKINKIKINLERKYLALVLFGVTLKRV